MKNTIILVHKLNIGNLDNREVNDVMIRYHERIHENNKFDDVEIIHYILPIIEGHNDITCIYPEKITDRKYKQRIDKLIKDLDKLNEPFLPIVESRKRKLNFIDKLIKIKK